MMKRILQITLVLLSSAMPLPAQSASIFAKASQEYSSGDFKAALDDYEQLVRSGQRTSNLFYDLGNTYFREKDFGRAILNYERALALDRHHPEADANLRIARDEARSLELVPATTDRAFAFASPNQLAVVAAISFWVAAFGIAFLILGATRKRGVILLSILALLILGTSTFGVYALEHGRNGANLAIVISDNVEARLATADTSHTVLALPAGSEIKIESRRGDWIYAALPNNLHGWMPANSAERVRL
jgi:tetratricopeptide (TPR) repeat protein